MQNANPATCSRMTSSRILATACGALLLIVTYAIGGQSVNRTITWGGNTSDWNRALHLGAVRLGCSDAPARCVDDAGRTSKSQGVDKVFIAILLNAEKTPAYAREYSQLSAVHPYLYEVGFDDFVGQCERQKRDLASLSALLNQTARELKGANPKLHLGITVYEDELFSSSFPLNRLDEEFRQGVDFVHLYPHYRKESQSFSASVRQATQIFPSARIIPGIYAYDRRDYLPCARGGAPCSNQEEISLFAESLKERLAIVGSSNADWIEFYPGGFGSESQWDHWKDPRSCRQERLQECIENTKAMRELVRQALNQQALH
jgi:hypothetical protein